MKVNLFFKPEGDKIFDEATEFIYSKMGKDTPKKSF